MPCRDFLPEDIITICCDIARRDNILAQQRTKKPSGIFQRLGSSSNDEEAPKPPRTSKLARGLSFSNGIPYIDNTMSEPESPSCRKVDSNANNDVPGLKGRDIVAMAILVNKDGSPIKTYTEAQHIPSDEVDAANNIFLSRVPMASPRQHIPENNNIGDYKPLADFLEQMEPKHSIKLLKRLERILMKLHTTDVNTAISFLKVDRYRDVRQETKDELISFARKELKLTL